MEQRRTIMPVNWHLSVFLFVLLSAQYSVGSLSHSLNSSIISALEALRHTTEELTAVQRALPTPVLRKNPQDCAAIFQQGHKESGVYRIWPETNSYIGSFNVYCDMTTDGGGWTVIQRRGQFGNSKDYFFKSWEDYKLGFGELTKDHWLGNDRIFAVTNQGEYTLRFDLKTVENETGYAAYSEFWIENEVQAYKLHAGGFTGNVGDSLLRGNGEKFSTRDRDNDIYEGHCAESYKGAWWYEKCHLANLNGLYHFGSHESYADGVNWNTWKGYYYSLKDTEMKVRPKYFADTQGLQ